jgi:hypothetical protein
MFFEFYFETAACVALWWFLAASVTQQPLYEVTAGSMVTILSWMPKQFVLLLQRHQPLLFNCETIGLALATSFSDSDAVRILAAILYSLYHLTESSEPTVMANIPFLYHVGHVHS